MDLMHKGRFSRGSMELLVLKILSEKDCYGYEILQLAEEYSDGEVTFSAAALYAALYSFEENGYISSRTETIGRRRQRIYYHMEEAGREAFEEMRKAYRETEAGIRKILEHTAERQDTADSAGSCADPSKEPKAPAAEISGRRH